MSGQISAPETPATRPSMQTINLSLVYPPPSPSVINSVHGTPLQDSQAAKTSNKGCLTIHRYEPSQAIAGIPELLTVHLTYSDVVSSDASLVQLRLNVGGQYIPTSVRPGPKLTLEANAVIPVTTLAQTGTKLKMSVHAYRNGEMFDSCDFGSLKVVGEDDARSPFASPIRSSRKRTRPDSDSDYDDSDDDAAPTPAPRKFNAKDFKARRKALDVDSLEGAILQLVIDGDLDSMTNISTWSSNEKSQGRRLVCFFRNQIDRTVTLSFKRITRGDEAGTDGIVISCLLPPDQKFCFITSVDFVRLISMLVNPATKKLSIDEKNRIRRSLEVFQPMTVKKTDPKTVGMFNYLLCLHEPRPITIAKDIKIFEWETLEDGLTKILAKYAYNAAEDTLFEHAMGIRHASPRKALVVQMSTPTQSRPARSNKPRSSPTPRRARLEPLSLKLPPIQHVLPGVFVHGPDDEDSLRAASPARALSVASSYDSASPSPSLYSPDSSDYSKTTAPTTPIDDVFTATSGYLSAANSSMSISSWASGPFHEDAGNSVGLLQVGVYDVLSDTYSEASAGDDFGTTTVGQTTAEASHEHFNLAHTYPAHTMLVGSSSTLSVADSISEAAQALYSLGSSSYTTQSLQVPGDPLQYAMKTPASPATGSALLHAPPTTPVDNLFELPDLNESIPMSELDELLNMFEADADSPFDASVPNINGVEFISANGGLESGDVEDATDANSATVEYAAGVDAVNVTQEWANIDVANDESSIIRAY